MRYFFDRLLDIISLIGRNFATFFIILVMCCCLIYRYTNSSKRSIDKSAPKFVYFTGRDIIDDTMELSYSDKKLTVKLNNIALPLYNLQDNCEKNLHVKMRPFVYSTLMKAKEILLYTTDKSGKITYGNVLVDKQDLDSLLDQEGYGYKLDKKSKVSSWCSLLEKVNRQSR